MVLKNQTTKLNFSLTDPYSIFKVFLHTTSFWVQDVCQVNMSGDLYQVHV